MTRMDSSADFFVMKPMASFGVYGGELRDFDASFGASYGPSSFRPSAEYGDGVSRFCLGRRDRVGRVLAWRDLFTAVAPKIESNSLNDIKEFEKPAVQPAVFFARVFRLRAEPSLSKKAPPKEKKR
jgi:hypothetical protein